MERGRKHGDAKRRIWRMVRIGIDEETLEVRAVEVTGSNIGDAPMLLELLDQIPADKQIGSVTADGAYDTRKCHEAPGASKYLGRASGDIGADTTAEAALRAK